MPEEVPGPAVKAALAAYAHALYDRPTPTHLSDEALMRIVLKAAVPLMLPEGTVTEWGVRYTRPPALFREDPPEVMTDRAADREAARRMMTTPGYRRLPGGAVLVSRQVTPWAPAPGEENEDAR